MIPGHPVPHNTEHERRGAANLFLFTALLAGWREVKVTDHLTRVDFAHVVRELVDILFPDAEWITLVLDDLTTRVHASRYHAFEPAEAKRIGASWTSILPPRKATG